MCAQEVGCFARALRCAPEQIRVFDLLTGRPGRALLDAVDVVLLGGSGDYSVARGGPWLERALDAMRDLHARSKPTFASCWGFQAMARALGGKVVTDLARAELGTLELRLSESGQEDPLFGPLGPTLLVHMGHQDIVDSLPADAVLLASSDRVENQAFRFTGKPIESATRLAAEVCDDVEEFFAAARGQGLPWSDARVFPVRIRRNIRLAEAPSFGQSIFAYAPDSNGARDHMLLAAEVIEQEARDPDFADLPRESEPVTELTPAAPPVAEEAAQEEPDEAPAEEPAPEPAEASADDTEGSAESVTEAGVQDPVATRAGEDGR